MGTGIHTQVRDLPDSAQCRSSLGATRIPARAYCAQLIGGQIRLADIPDDFRDMALSMAQHAIWRMAKHVSSQRNRDAWKAELFAVPDDLRETVNRLALDMFHRARGTTG